MENVVEITELAERIIHKYVQMENQKREYLPGVILTTAEIHTIACIGDHLRLNLTQLARFMGITKSAASQMIYKLRDRGLVKKEVSPDSDAAVCLTLTEDGQKAYDAHSAFHASANNRFSQLFFRMPQEAQQQLKRYAQGMDKLLDEILQK